MIDRESMTGPWAGMPVSWTDTDMFDEQRYRANVARCCQAGIPGIYTGGTTGEFYAMEIDEFRAVTRATVEECRAHDTPVMIGCTSTYTLGAIRRAAYAAELGADAIQVALPYWMEVTSEGALGFVNELACAVPDIALSIYETTRAKKTLTLEEHKAIHDDVPAYVMAKANAGTLGATPEGCRQLNEFVNVFVSETRWPELGPYGALGSCSALIYMNPKLILHLWHLVRTGEWEELDRCIGPVLEWDHWLGERFEPEGYTDTAYDHLQGMLAGFLDCGLRSRGPYRVATEADLCEAQQWARRHTPEVMLLDYPLPDALAGSGEQVGST